LNENFNLEIAPSALFDYPTVESLAEHISLSISADDRNVLSAARKDNENMYVATKEEKTKAPFELGHTGQLTGKEEIDGVAPKSFNSYGLIVVGREALIGDFLLPLRRGDSNRPPVILIHGGYGIIYGSRILSVTDPGQPVYATQAIEHVTQEWKFRGLQWRIDYYVKMIQETFGGPGGVHLIGYSYGATLCYEIGLCLEKNEFPFSLTLLDPVPSYNERPCKDFADDTVRFYHALLPNLDLTEVLKEAPVVWPWRLDQAVFEHLGQDVAQMNAIQAAREFGKICLQELDEWYLVQDPVKLRLKIPPNLFVLEGNGDLFKDIDPEEAATPTEKENWKDKVGGWTKRFESEINKVECQGFHTQFFANDDNVKELGICIARCDTELAKLVVESANKDK